MASPYCLRGNLFSKLAPWTLPLPRCNLEPTQFSVAPASTFLGTSVGVLYNVYELYTMCSCV